jgi:hypothetical protein
MCQNQHLQFFFLWSTKVSCLQIIKEVIHIYRKWL